MSGKITQIVNYQLSAVNQCRFLRHLELAEGLVCCTEKCFPAACLAGGEEQAGIKQSMMF